MKLGQIQPLIGKPLTGEQKQQAIRQSNIATHIDKYSTNKPLLAAKLLDEKLTDALGMNNEQSKTTPIFDFQAVVDNVLDFVTGALKKAKTNGSDDDTLKAMLKDARRGVEQGVNEAIDILSENKVINKDIETGISKAKEGIYKGFNELEERLLEPKNPYVLVSNSQYTSLQNQAQYTFTTKEGDKIVIAFEDSMQALSNVNTHNDKSNQIDHELNFTININGELNDAEQQALNDLMKDIKKVSDSFFSGEYDEAFKKAKELNITNEQITQFSMDLKQTKTVAAIGKYQQLNPIKEIDKELQPFNTQLDSIYEQAKTIQLDEQLTQLMQWMNYGQARANEIIEYASSFFSQLNDKDSEKHN